MTRKIVQQSAGRYVVYSSVVKEFVVEDQLGRLLKAVKADLALYRKE